MRGKAELLLQGNQTGSYKTTVGLMSIIKLILCFKVLSAKVEGEEKRSFCCRATRQVLIT